MLQAHLLQCGRTRKHAVGAIDQLGQLPARDAAGVIVHVPHQIQSLHKVRS